jgi:hypothetical protein
VEKSTLISMLMSQLFDEVMRECSSSTLRPLDIAIKLAVVDSIRFSNYDTSGKIKTTETIRDLLNPDNS